MRTRTQRKQSRRPHIAALGGAATHPRNQLRPVGWDGIRATRVARNERVHIRQTRFHVTRLLAGQILRVDQAGRLSSGKVEADDSPDHRLRIRDECRLAGEFAVDHVSPWSTPFRHERDEPRDCDDEMHGPEWADGLWIYDSSGGEKLSSDVGRTIAEHIVEFAEQPRPHGRSSP